MNSSPIKILIVEDHPLTRQSLSFGLKRSGQFAIVGEAANGQEALPLVESGQPDVVLMDIVLPVLNGIKATEAIKGVHPEVKIVMLTSHGEEEKVFAAFAAGADGYCMKEIKIERLAQVVEMVYEGALWMDPSIARYVLKVMPLLSQGMAKSQDAHPHGYEAGMDLSHREKEILALMAEGLHNKDIADQLCISIYTVKNHVRSIIQKLAVEDRTQAAVLALKKGLI